MITITTDIDIVSRGVMPVIHLSQYDSDFTLVFNVFASEGTFTMPSGTTAEIRGTKTDGNGYDASGSVSGKVVTITGDEQMTAVAGKNIFEIALYYNNKRLNTINFVLDVERAALDADTISSESVLRELDAIVEGAEVATEAAAEAEAAAATFSTDTTLTVSGKAADAKVTGKKLKETARGFFTVPAFQTYITNASNWNFGQDINNQTGGNRTTTKGCRTGYCAFTGSKLFTLDNSDYIFTVWTYSDISISSAISTPKAQYDGLQAIILQSTDPCYFRAAVRRADGADITTDYTDPASDAYKIINAIKIYSITDKSLTATEVPADAKATGDALNMKLGYVAVLNRSHDLDDFGSTGAYLWLGEAPPANNPAPEESTSYNSIMNVIHAHNTSGFVLQTVHTQNGKMYQRYKGSSTWYPWHEISAGSGGGSVENYYNITTSPTITTDTHGWLAAVDTDTADETGKTDMTGAIMSMLNDTGYCHLGEGIFYISGNIDMPEDSVLCGCGRKTVVRLLQSSTATYCVRMQTRNTVKDICFEGARSGSAPSTKGTRNGIAFVADTPTTDTRHCMADNVWFRYFSGAGIYCNKTSIRYDRGLYVTNAYIYACYAGIDINQSSEFNKFTNVCTAWCTIGCINNGGNNVFTACTFHATDTGFYIDGTQPNSAHGTINGCTFCHIGSNAGKAISINDVINGFIIDSCQIWYNSLDFNNSSGIIVSNCELGRGTTGAGATINISGGDTILFSGCMFMRDDNYTPDITITDNTKVKFVNCFGSATGNAINGA